MEHFDYPGLDCTSGKILEACENGNTAILSSISDGKPILNEIEKKGISPLIVACRHGQIGIVRHILQHDYYVIDPQILAQAASVARESGYEQIRSLLTLYYIKYYRHSA